MKKIKIIGKNFITKVKKTYCHVIRTSDDEIRLTRYAGVMKSSFVMWMMMKSGFVTWYNQITYAKFPRIRETFHNYRKYCAKTNTIDQLLFVYRNVCFPHENFHSFWHVILKRNNVMWNSHYTIFRKFFISK